MKFNLSNFFGKKKDVATKAANFGVSQNFQFVNGTLTWLPDKFSSYIVNGYQANDIIYSIINMIMDKIRVAPWGLYQVIDDNQLKKYTALIDKKDFVEAAKIKKKALEPLTKFSPKASKLNDLLKYPNDTETWADFVANGCGYKMLLGNKYVWANILDAGANKGLPQELINVPGQFMGIRATTSFPQRVTGYYLSSPFITEFAKEVILHEKLWNPDYSVNGSGLYGQSPIKAAIKTLTRNNAAKKAGATQLDNNGAAGIAFVDDAVVPATGRTEQANAIKSVWAKEYTGAGNYGKVAFSGYKMGYVSVGSSLKDMDLTAIEEIDLRKLCNIWGIPSQILNDVANSTYNNVKEAEKALTSRCAMPYLVASRDNLNRKLKSDWGLKAENIYVDFDTSVYTELQEDQAEKWGWVNTLPVSPAYKLELMGLDIPDDPNLQTILVDGTLVPLSEVIAGLGSMTDQQAADTQAELNKAGIYDYLKVAK